MNNSASYKLLDPGLRFKQHPSLTQWLLVAVLTFSFVALLLQLKIRELSGEYLGSNTKLQAELIQIRSQRHSASSPSAAKILQEQQRCLTALKLISHDLAQGVHLDQIQIQPDSIVLKGHAANTELIKQSIYAFRSSLKLEDFSFDRGNEQIGFKLRLSY